MFVAGLLRAACEGGNRDEVYEQCPCLLMAPCTVVLTKTLLVTWRLGSVHMLNNICEVPFHLLEVHRSRNQHNEQHDITPRHDHWIWRCFSQQRPTKALNHTYHRVETVEHLHWSGTRLTGYTIGDTNIYA